MVEKDKYVILILNDLSAEEHYFFYVESSKLQSTKNLISLLGEQIDSSSMLEVTEYLVDQGILLKPDKNLPEISFIEFSG